MDASVAPVPEAFLRRVPKRDGQSSSFVDHGPRPLDVRILGPDGAGAVALDSGGWGLHGVAHMHWPAWQRDQDTASGGRGDDNSIAAVGQSVAHGEGSKGRGWNPYEPSRVSSNTGHSSGTRLGRSVGPFGKGTGAAGSRQVPASFGLFGDVQEQDGALTVGSGIVPRSPDVRRGGAVATSAGGNVGRPRLRGESRPNTGGAGNKTDDWIPDLTVGVGPRRETAVAAENTDGSSSLGLPGNAPVVEGGNAPGTMGMGYLAMTPTPVATATLGTSDCSAGRGQTSTGLGTVDRERRSENGGVKGTSWMAAAAKRQPAAGNLFGAGLASEFGSVEGSTVSAVRPSAAAPELGVADPEAFAARTPQTVEEEGSEVEDNPFA